MTGTHIENAREAKVVLVRGIAKRPVYSNAGHVQARNCL